MPGSPAPAPISLLAQILYGSVGEDEVPSLPDLAGALIGLASGRQKKALLPLVTAPLEVALVRRGDEVLVSLYEIGSVPEVITLDRPVRLEEALSACADELRLDARLRNGAAAAEVLERLADRAQSTAVSRLGSRQERAATRKGGALTEPPEDVPLAFGFRAQIAPGQNIAADGASRADVHALLFPGELWAWARGHRHMLARGPIMPAVGRMVTAVRMLLDAWDADRGANVRLNAGDFTIGVRLEQEVTLTLGRRSAPVTLTALDVPGAALPILRIASDVIRAMIATDRSQARNLKVRALREEVRELRRRIRTRGRDDGFVNADADRLRAGSPATRMPSDAPGRGLGDGLGAAAPPAVAPSPVGKLRFAERWSVELDELDSTSTFFCGDRLVIATPRRAVAVSREDGSVLWVREGIGGSTHMAGTTLVRLSSEGDVELCDVIDGEPFATTRVGTRGNNVPRALFVGGGPVPATVLLPDGPGSFVAVDLRNGEHRFGYTSKGPGPLRLSRAGRMVLATAGDGTLDAIDAAAGKVVWRHSDSSRFCFAAKSAGDTVLAVSGDPQGRSGALLGLDLFSGERRFRVELPAPPSAAPTPAGRQALVAIGGKRKGSLASVDLKNGGVSWMVSDPGIGTGGAALAVDRTLIVNNPGGEITALDLEDGATRWRNRLADPVADDIPRSLEPVLRGGALFVPTAQVHVVRPTDGSPLGASLPCNLVPDLIRVDERGWVYVAEESGHLSAYAPIPHLSLVR